MSTILKLYLKALHSHPWKTQMLTTGFLMGTSDVIAQTCIEKRRVGQIELSRVSRFAVLGTFFVAPVIRTWYIVLEKKFGAVGKTVGLKKMLCDQLMFSPCFIATFLAVLGTVQLQPWQDIKAKVKNVRHVMCAFKEYFSILKTNYMLWPGAQLITFYIIPFQMRLVFVSGVSLVWNTYLAYRANKDH